MTWQNAAGVVGLAAIVVSTCLREVALFELRDQATECAEQLDDARERLTEVDCSAPLNPRLPFAGMGLWRAVYCPGSQPSRR